MLQSGKNPFILKKSYEVAYAIFRIAPHVSNINLKDRLEGQALALVDAAAVENYSYLSLVARSIEYLARFGSDVAVMNNVNAEAIVKELNILNAAIVESGNPAIPQEVSLEGIFSESKAEDLTHGEPVERIEHIKEHSPLHDSESGNQESGSMSGIIKSAMRQSAILDRIRQSGNCRLKEIQEILPESSERTIRYDLQSLLEQNLIERIGNGGPAVYYRARQAA